jgi:hypothetical protein
MASLSPDPYFAEKRIILTHQEAVRQVRARVTQFVTERWNGLTSWRDADISAFVDAVLPSIESGERYIYQLTDSYLAAMARMAGQTPLPSGKPVTGADLRNGADPATVYSRPGSTVYAALSNGKTIGEAVAMGLVRLEQMLAMDMQLAMTHAAQRHMKASPGIVGYRRVLTGAENCALCTLASTQRYHRGDLMPIHDRCDCSVAPMYGNSDPGQIINADLYGALKQQFADKYPGAFSGGGWESTNKPNSHIRIAMHGEHGPTLTWADQHFTGPNQL